MKHFFDETEKEEWTDVASHYDRKVTNALRPIFKEAREQGLSMRELHYIVNMSCLDLSLSKLMGWDDEKNETKQTPS